MALPPSTANWHWKNKNVTKWAKEWFEKELVTLSVSGDSGETVSIDEVREVDGDVELGQRKSKLITIFDCKVVIGWTGKTAGGEDVKGSLTLPEVSHEITVDHLSDYQYEWRLQTATSAEVNAVYQLAKSKLPAVLEAKLAEFPTALVDTHGKDIYVSAEPSRTSTPAPSNGSAATSAAFKAGAAAPAAKVEEKKKAVNTTTVVVEATFQASAEQLYNTLTTERDIYAWTRAPAKSDPRPEGEYSLFNGNVTGKYISLTPHTEVVQTWLLNSPTWPQGHVATLTTTFDQSTDSTKITFSLSNVPIGSQDEIKRNLEGYYVHGFKSIGYAYLLPVEPVHSSSYNPESTKPKSKNGTAPPPPSSSSSYLPAILIASLVLAAAFAVPYLSSSPIPPPK
ncbi:hypothetical protein AX16_006681 [Volvariella volvacea WC 439]|nr:hypothetical protein AX16_006681 [Volvariella volvacea WC 439]